MDGNNNNQDGNKNRDVSVAAGTIAQTQQALMARRVSERAPRDNLKHLVRFC